MNKQKGITLVALVITIIVLLILAGVTMAALSGPNGILSNAVKANEETAKSQAREAVSLAVSEILTQYYVDDTTGGTPTDITTAGVIASIEKNYPDFENVAVDSTPTPTKVTMTINSVDVEVAVTVTPGGAGKPSTWSIGAASLAAGD